MYAAAPTMGLADGADEVHKATVARRVLRDYRPQEHPLLAVRVHPPPRREAGPGAKFEPKFEADPELRAFGRGRTRSTSPAAAELSGDPTRNHPTRRGDTRFLRLLENGPNVLVWRSRRIRGERECAVFISIPPVCRV